MRRKRVNSTSSADGEQPPAAREVGKLPWTEDMDLCLLKLVLHHGAHLPHMAADKKSTAAKNGAPTFHAKPADRWREVTKDFFREANGGLNYAAKHFKMDAKGLPDYRKMKDHFDTLCKDVYEDIQTGNQSGKDGDLSEKYNLVQSIMTEADEAEALKEGKKAEKEELQEKLTNTTEAVLNGTKHNANKNTAIRIKMSDGTIVVDEERAAKKARVAMTNSLDSRMLAVLDAVVAKTAVSEEQRKAQQAEKALQQLRHYILFHGHCLEAFLYEAFVNTSSGAPPPELIVAIQDIGGLDALISTYCSRDDYFSPASFKATLAEFNIPKLYSHLMHLRLDKWRKDAEQFCADQGREEKKKRARQSSGNGDVSDLTGETTTAEFSQLQISEPPSPEAAPAPAADTVVIIKE